LTIWWKEGFNRRFDYLTESPADIAGLFYRYGDLLADEEFIRVEWTPDSQPGDTAPSS
jgi:hypothetical protein